jgi:excisionase family DNA binding protein
VDNLADALTITVPAAARKLGIGKNTAYEAIKRGEIPFVRIGRRVLVPVAAFEKMLSEPARRWRQRKSENS